MKSIISILLFLYIIPSNKAQSFTEINGEFIGVVDSKISIGDYNNDGYLDFVIAGKKDDVYTSYDVKLYKNNGNNSFTELSLASNINHVNQIRFFDFDNDGFLDMIAHINDPFSRVVIYFNKNGSFLEFELSLYTLGQSFDLGDIDNDSDIDIVVSGFYDPGEFTRIYTNTGNFTYVERSMFIQDKNFHDLDFKDIKLLDYDLDGDLEIVLSDEYSYDKFRIYFNDGGYFKTFIEIYPNLSFSDLAWADFDTDGDYDFVVCGMKFTYQTSIYQNQGNNSFIEILAEITDVYGGSVVWGDYDNDGDTDILLTGFTGSIPIAEIIQNIDNASFQKANIVLQGVVGGVGKFLDINNDNNLDIIVSGSVQYNVNTTKVYKNNLNKANLSPLPPYNLANNFSENKIYFLFESSSDDHTKTNGLSYNIYLKNLSKDTVIIYPNSSLDFGKLKTVEIGNINKGRNFFLTQDNLPAGLYEWKTQAIDESYLGSDFSDAKYFKVYKFINELGQYIIADAGENFLIEWEVIIPQDSINLYYSTDFGYTWKLIADNLPDIGNYNWKLPNIPYKPIQLKISDSENTNQFSISNFNIEVSALPFSVSEVYPNPSNSTINIELNLEKESVVTAEIFDFLGQRVFELCDNKKVEPGTLKITWDHTSTTISSGFYLLRLFIGSDSYTKKMLILK